VAALDGAGLDGIKDLKAGNDLAAGEDADVELAVGELPDPFGDEVPAAVDGVQALGEARGRSQVTGHRLQVEELD